MADFYLRFFLNQLREENRGFIKLPGLIVRNIDFDIRSKINILRIFMNFQFSGLVERNVGSTCFPFAAYVSVIVRIRTCNNKIGVFIGESRKAEFV